LTALPDDITRAGGLLDVDAEMVENISDLVDAGQRGMVLNLLADLYPADISLLLERLPYAQAQQVFQWLPVEEASEVVVEMDSDLRAELLEEAQTERVAAIIDEMETDDAADVLAELPEAVAQQVLPALEDAADVQELLGYAEDTAGGIMGTEYVAVQQAWTVSRATEEVRHSAEAFEPYVVYVVDEQERLEGFVTLKHLLLARASVRIRDIMDPDVIHVQTDMDQEEVARIMERYDLVALPVVNAGGVLVGSITIDDVVDVIREEAEEDLQRISGVSPDESPFDTVLEISRSRLPWLVTGLGASFISGLVIETFSGELEKAVALAMFIPIITAMGGNAAIQSAAITVQGLTSREVWVEDMLRRIGKEALVALLNGLALALLIGSVVILLNALGVLHPGAPYRLALTVGLTLFTVILLATSNGVLMPFLLKRAGADPTSAMGPFVTTLNDIIGLTVYFLYATVLYLG
jgi:magnesium transporter